MITRSMALAAALMAASTAASAQERTTIKASVGWGGQIDIHVYKPKGAGPFPLMVISHGSPRRPEARSNLGPNTLSAQASAYVGKGFVVAVPMRRGYGASSGGWAEGYGSCASPDYYNAGLATAADIRAAVTAVSADAAVDKSRIVLMGVSAGGWGSMAAATYGIPGLKAVVNFAGGRGSRGPNDVCGGDAPLVSAAGRFGSGAGGVPQLWVYSSNDLFFGPELAGKMHEAFTQNGGKADFVRAPAYGADGHAYFNAVGAWRGRVDSFLRQTGAMR
jgi:dienelactone hydrolase